MMDKIHDSIRGCMIGGAAGDALGYPAEFMGYKNIMQVFGRRGMTEYQLHNGKALVSDDTQMTLFTANGLLAGETRGKLRGIMAEPWSYAVCAYMDWYRTQALSYGEAVESYRREPDERNSWLCNIPELYSRRAPGMTCLTSLSSITSRNDCGADFIKRRRNSSKGCGGIMRTAPVALDAYTHKLPDSDLVAAECAAATHGHSLGFMPSAFLNNLLISIVYNEISLGAAAEDSLEKTKSLFSDDSYIGELRDIIRLAIRLSSNSDSDIDNIQRLGEGWVAEEALAIALYSALRYQDNFSKGIITAVNHSGDSDSTGAICGNILGALLGYDSIEEKWKTDLELKDIILTLADDLYTGCPMDSWVSNPEVDRLWGSKYIRMDYSIS